MKRSALLGITIVLALALSVGVSFAAKYKPGKYKGEATGYNSKKHPGKIEVEVTVDENSIKDIALVTFVQTEKGKQGERTAEAKETIPGAIVKKQSLNVDSVAKASGSSMGIELAVAQALEQATVAYKDGVYKGSSKGYNSKKHPGQIDVEVTIAGGKISKIDVVNFHQSTEGKKGELTAKAKAEVPAAIVAKQTVAVDVISKASFSSNGLKLAVARALEQAR